MSFPPRSGYWCSRTRRFEFSIAIPFAVPTKTFHAQSFNNELGAFLIHLGNGDLQDRRGVADFLSRLRLFFASRDGETEGFLGHFVFGNSHSEITI